MHNIAGFMRRSGCGGKNIASRAGLVYRPGFERNGLNGH